MDLAGHRLPRQAGRLPRPRGFWTPLLDAVRGLGTAGFAGDALAELVVGATLDQALAALESRLVPVDPGLRAGT
ncbi:MAG: hypothetical protein R2731_07785 [Nocardioides sp.]